MIISPPLLKTRVESETDYAWIDRVMKLSAGRGFPKNLLNAWHSGIHIEHSDSGGKSEEIRAIADGDVIFVRRPVPDAHTKPPLLYEGKRNHNGCVILKHHTEIGSGANGKVEFYSLYMHLTKIKDKVQKGKKLYRKDPIGSVGETYDVSSIHFQVFCDDVNLKKLVGRTTATLSTEEHGRTDVLYGNIHFYLPGGSLCLQHNPHTLKTSREQSSNPVVYTVPANAPLYVTMQFVKGNCIMTTRQQSLLVPPCYDVVGDKVIDEGYEYKLYETVMTDTAYKHSPSACYELLRFGRLVNPEYEKFTEKVTHWRKIRTPKGLAWVNLAPGLIKKYSDADFPHWMGWMLISDDKNMDSQCESPTIKQWESKAKQGSSAAKAALEHCMRHAICQFPYEWNAATLDKRYSWMKNPPPDRQVDKLSDANYKAAMAFMRALCTDNPGFDTNQKFWHFDPRAFIGHFRKCGWLGESDLIRVVRHKYKYLKERIEKDDKKDKKIYVDHAGSEISKDKLKKYLNESGKDRYEQINRPDNIGNHFSKMLLKYGVSTPLRLAHFLAQILQETGRFYEVMEQGQKDYFNKYEIPTATAKKLGNTQKGDGALFKGRGVIQVTGRFNYRSYGKYRGNSEQFLTGANASQLVFNPYLACDSAGFYWISKQRYKQAGKKNVKWGELSIHYWADQGKSPENALAVTKCINGGANHHNEARWPYFGHADYVLNDNKDAPPEYLPIPEV